MVELLHKLREELAQLEEEEEEEEGEKEEKEERKGKKESKRRKDASPDRYCLYIITILPIFCGQELFF